MALEIERRFLIATDGWRAHAGVPMPLRQAYLAASADGVTVRVRLGGADQAWLTLKAAADASGLVRHEFEYSIPVADAEALWSLAPHRLAKTRCALELGGGNVAEGIDLLPVATFLVQILGMLCGQEQTPVGRALAEPFAQAGLVQAASHRQWGSLTSAVRVRGCVVGACAGAHQADGEHDGLHDDIFL